MDLGDMVATIVGIAVLVVVGIAVIGFAVTVGITAIALRLAVVGAIVGYIIGIPWAVAFRVKNGRWPEQ